MPGPCLIVFLQSVVMVKMQVIGGGRLGIAVLENVEYKMGHGHIVHGHSACEVKFVDCHFINIILLLFHYFLLTFRITFLLNFHINVQLLIVVLDLVAGKVVQIKEYEGIVDSLIELQLEALIDLLGHYGHSHIVPPYQQH